MSYRKSFQTVYHGTSKAALESILKEGIIPGKGPGADEWATATRGYRAFGKEHGVFLSPIAGVAALFSQLAEQATRQMHGRNMVDGGVVLEIDFSAADTSKLHADSQFDMVGDAEQALVYGGAIPLEWIRSYCEVHPTAARLPPVLSTAYLDNPDLQRGPPVPVKTPLLK